MAGAAQSRLLRDVSRETAERLQLYEALLRKWQKAINLVAPKTLDALWERHFLDSAQLLDIAPKGVRHWLDIGTGGGFPGLICAVIAAEKQPETRFTFIESDARKSSFLREVQRQLGIHGEVLTSRIESAPPQDADLISARALAPLPKLMHMAHPHLTQNGTCLFLKGATYRSELETIPDGWQMSLEVVPSITSTDSVILKIGDLSYDASQ